ncbi:class I SAM-dependent DNA methyltransferase [Streptomyces sp. ICN988]|uniref:Eco57I restriction-modification methylase domain-containing protein n=1 Tax=Streptomyces sp. ICN988 TaxID=2983765 RepID=UPI0021E3E796|nr:class I SAM-dependent DNA methyltransferase [Streptomyces sp. ICN988]MCV2463858.1 class I SAM-dependent DNA methyltransferase [Streptomyces sp. ICN988]
MTFDSLVNRGDYFSAHYLAEVLPKDLKSGLLAEWKQREEDAAGAERPEGALPVTPRAGLRALRRPYFAARSYFTMDEERAATGDDAVTYDAPEWRDRVRVLNAEVLHALGFDAKPGTLTVVRADQSYEVTVAHAEKDLVALDCGWSAEPDDALDPDGSGRLLEELRLDGQHTVATGSKLASFLFACEDAPRYVLLLVGGVVVLADRAAWGEGRYLAVSLDTALERNDIKAGGELDTVAALFGADSLRTPEEGGENPLATLVDKSTKHAVGVSSELRDGLRLSVELIANEVLDRVREGGVRPEEVKELPELGRQLTRESLRYLYRILFLLYAEARPELGILPSDYPEYQMGYGLGRLGELIAEQDLVDEKSRKGYYLYESLDLLFSKVQEGYRPRRTHGVDAETPPEAVTAKTSEDMGLRFEPLHSKLFEPEAIRLIGARAVPDPRVEGEAEDGGERFIDTRLRNETLYRVLRLLMLTRGKKRERGGFISYAQLGINQLGAVYEGLMSYSGFVAGEELYEVAKHGDPKDGSWLVPATKADEYPDEVFVRQKDEDTGEERRVRYAPGAFVYRLSGRDRQTSASYYTPESLTRVTVQLALQHRLDQDDTVTEARELLDWKICEPALGSGAFLNEAINQVAAEYLRRRQDELGVAIDTEKYAVELQKAKAYIALHNSYGVDLNNTAVELAEVSLWLNTMHPGMEAPWFGLHLRRGNSLIGGRREVYSAERLKKGGWLGTTPERFPLAEAVAGAALPEGAVHHFLLPAKEWGAVAAEKEAKALAPAEAKALGAWRKAITKSPSAAQTKRLQGLARRAEYLWGLVVRRLEISEREISRRVDVWGAEDGWLRSPEVAVPREKVKADLEAVDTPYWRLKTLMDAWCALWFWPVQEAALLDGSHKAYVRAAEVASQSAGWTVSAAPVPAPSGAPERETYESEDLFGDVQVVEVKSKAARGGSRKEQIRGERRAVIPLASLDDWLDFAESLLGTQDVATDSLVAQFDTLDELERYEDELPEWMGMERFTSLESRYPWAGAARDVAEQQGFFHWELEFAAVFAGRGGFDVQVGNPPWVRPDWQEDAVLAELEPWFALASKPSAAERQLQKVEILNQPHALAFHLEELASVTATAGFLSSSTMYSLLNKTRPDFYRAFMIQSWHNMNSAGITGLIHPDTHFSGSKEGILRESAYRHLRVHAGFINGKNWAFPHPVGHTALFGLHIYGNAQTINFIHVSQLYGIEPLTGSPSHNGRGKLPGIKFQGKWDLRPHRARLISVDMQRLTEWNRLTGNSQVPDSQAALLYPITTEEEEAISALSANPLRLSQQSPNITVGMFENLATKKLGLYTWRTSEADTLDEVIIQGPHLNIALPFSKQPNVPCRNHLDWTAFDLTRLPTEMAPRTNYVRATSKSRYESVQDTWNGRRYTEYFRLAWRSMIPFDTERSLFAALIPPGPAHVHTVQSMALADNRLTALNAGFWAALPLDYLLRITGRSHLQVAEAHKMPAPTPDHPLTHPLLLRTLRLNSLTNAYAPIWKELFHPTWPNYEEWANPSWPNLEPLAGHLKSTWEYDTPLRTEYERRAALVELDALVSVWLGITADQLVAIYKSRYPVLSDYESAMHFDANGRKIAGNHNTYGRGQTKQDYIDLLTHLQNPETTPPPVNYTAPFYKADREAEMRAAHAHFQARLDKEIAAGRWAPPGSREA